MGRAVKVCVALACVLILSVFLTPRALAVADRRFDVCWLNTTPDGSEQHFTTNNLAHLNWVSTNGHFLAMPTDANRPAINANGNFMCGYYNTLTSLYGTYNGSQAADQIENYMVANFTSNGVVPQWIALNEISAGSWPSDASYRAWLRTCIGRLKNTYNYNVILFSPFPNPANNASDWVPLSQNCYIAIECYLTGAQVNASGNSVSWCQTQYQSSKNSYLNLGIAASRIYLTEHYGNSTSGATYGRAGVSSAGWDNAINARCQAIKNVGFAGVCSYGWVGNQMLISEAEQIQHEDKYKSVALP